VSTQTNIRGTDTCPAVSELANKRCRTKPPQPQERRALLRAANRADVERYRAFYTRPWNPASLDTAVHSFACECTHPECDAQVELAVVDFPAPPDPCSPPVLATGHQTPEN
jgi:hypothetical protein